MKRTIAVILGLGTVVAMAASLFVYYDHRFPHGRMWETPAIRPHEQPIGVMDAGPVPFDGGEAEYRYRPAADIASPIGPNDASAIVNGSALYVRYCIQCHGKYHDGNGTVGQSFAPLPGDLRSKKVQETSDGALFKEISYGVPGGRQPALATTIEMVDRWQIVAYLKTLGVRP